MPESGELKTETENWVRKTENWKTNRKKTKRKCRSAEGAFVFFGTIVNNESAGRNYEINFPILIMQQLPASLALRSSKCKLTGTCRKLLKWRTFCGCIAHWITPSGTPTSRTPFNYGQHRYTHTLAFRCKAHASMRFQCGGLLHVD